MGPKQNCSTMSKLLSALDSEDDEVVTYACAALVVLELLASVRSHFSCAPKERRAPVF